jgi:hypothetical protein
MVEAGESEYSRVLKIRKELISRDTKNAENGKIAANWNVSGTRDFSFAKRNCGYRVAFVSDNTSTNVTGENGNCTCSESKVQMDLD